jgi:hypothetical protein
LIVAIDVALGDGRTIRTSFFLIVQKPQNVGFVVLL